MFIFIRTACNQIISFMAFLLMLFTANAIAQDEKQIANAAFQAALAHATKSYQTLINNNQALSYTATTQDNDKNQHIKRFTPEQLKDDEIVGTWQTIQKDEGFNLELNFDTDTLINGESLAELKTEYLKQTPKHWVFRLENRIKVDLAAGEYGDHREVPMNNAMTSNLFIELMISKQDAQITAMKVYAPKPFSPSFFSKIEHFEINVRYAPAWPDGPLVKQNLTSKVNSRYALFFNLAQTSSTQLGQFKTVNLK